MGRSGGFFFILLVINFLRFRITRLIKTDNLFRVLAKSFTTQIYPTLAILQDVLSFLVFLGVLIFLFVLLEVFSSWRFGVAVRKEVLHRGVAATLRLMGHEIWQQQSQYEPNPYSLYWNKPNSWVDGIRVTCSKGYRWHGREISEQSPDYRILILGGSTTFSNYCFQDYKESWSYKLELLLKSEFPESHIEVVNAGLNYGMTTELLSHFTFKGQFLNPDLVILHGPGNDSLPAALGDYSTDYSKTRDFVYHTVRPLERELLAKSGLLRCLYAIWLHSPHYAKLEPLVFPDNEIQAKNLNNCQGEAFINNLNSLISLCLAKKVTFAYLPFTYAPISRMKNFHGALSQAIYDFEERLSTKANDLIHTYNSRNVCFFDYDKSDFTEECFYDSCHLLSEGERRKSEIVAKKVINLLKVQ